jgi:hypothetical protein
MRCDGLSVLRESSFVVSTILDIKIVTVSFEWYTYYGEYVRIPLGGRSLFILSKRQAALRIVVLVKS